MKLIVNPNRKLWSKIIQRPVNDTKEIESRVKSILLNVKQNGNKALKFYTEKFDEVRITNFLVSEKEISEAVKSVDKTLKNAIKKAKYNLTKFHSYQKEKTNFIETTKGVLCWRKSVAIEKVGLYIPGGTAPLFSTVLMLGIPAKLAGCQEIILCTPPDTNGKINPAILFTAKLIGITKIYKVGGAQAIAAMAYGTKTIPKVYKILGPGNTFVTIAKQLVSLRDVAIDMPAGPSELLILADSTCVPEFVAADLLSQAEHGVDSQVILICNSKKIIDLILSEIENQIKCLPRKWFAKKALQNSKTILINNLNLAVDFINEYAPEHLILVCKNATKIATKISNAGSVFIGNYTPESAGDYASGTNHTLPTNGFAKMYSGVSLDSFVKKITFQKISKQGISSLGKTIEIMAEAEGLQAHKNAISLRINKKL